MASKKRRIETPSPELFEDEEYINASEASVSPFSEPSIDPVVELVAINLNIADDFQYIKMEFQRAQEFLKKEYDCLVFEGQWLWLSEDHKAGNTSNIFMILTHLFGVYAKTCFGLYEECAFVAIELFLPEEMPVGQLTDVCEKTKLYHRSFQNDSVYCKSSISLSVHIQKFLDIIKELGYFTQDDGEYFAPASLYSRARSQIAMNIVGAGNHLKIVSNSTNFYVTGIRSIKTVNKNLWAMGSQVLQVPVPKPTQWWQEHVYLKDESPPRVSLVNSNSNGIPDIPVSRQFQLKHKEKFTTLLDAVNEYVDLFVKMKNDGAEDDKLQDFICYNCVGLLHKYTPNFMSFIGAQYLQRICVEKQDDEYMNVDIDKPRSYYASEEFDEGRPMNQRKEYWKKIRGGEEKIIGSFVEVFGSLFFASHSYICAFVGEPGSGKNYVRRIATKIAGGKDVVFLIDDRFNNFSMQTFTSSHCLGIVEDAGNKQTNIPTVFKDSALGVARDSTDKETVNIDTKFKAPKQVKIDPLSFMYNRNAITGEAMNMPNINKVQRVVGSIQGFGGGNERRVRCAPPLNYKMSAGTVNPVDKITKKPAFDKDEGTDEEIPNIILISWMMATLGDQCRDVWHGLVGTYCSDELAALIDMYLDMGDVDKLAFINKLIKKNDTLEEYNCEGRIRKVGFCITSAELKKRYKAQYAKSFDLLPSEIGTVSNRAFVCKKCWRFFPKVSNVPKLKEDVQKLCDEKKIDCDCKIELCRGVLKNYSFTCQ